MRFVGRRSAWPDSDGKRLQPRWENEDTGENLNYTHHGEVRRKGPRSWRLEPRGVAGERGPTLPAPGGDDSEDSLERLDGVAAAAASSVGSTRTGPATHTCPVSPGQGSREGARALSTARSQGCSLHASRSSSLFLRGVPEPPRGRASHPGAAGAGSPCQVRCPSATGGRSPPQACLCRPDSRGRHHPPRAGAWVGLFPRPWCLGALDGGARVKATCHHLTPVALLQ